MILFAVYDLTTGEILRSGQCADGDLELQAGDGQAVIERASQYQHDGNSYVDLSGPEPMIAERQEMPATLNGLTITGVPLGATLRIEGVDYAVGDGAAELSFTLPGAYTVKLSCWPYLDKIFEVVSA